ncbi:MAG: DUF2797 domain-containing protein [Candidatus Lokiarchaeota archaeon]|nr:DUF2797 domain-containing protein [Candidatus Lokiarchaeota archaeon]
MHILNVIWNETPTGEFEHGLQVWKCGSRSPITFPIILGEKVSWTIQGPKTCIGYLDSKMQTNQCPDTMQLPKTSIKCGPCSAMDFVQACVRCDGRNCLAQPERWEKCKNTEYAIYVALFKSGAVKVGVSTLGRVRTRCIEQGADYAAIVQKVTGGKLARSIESRLGHLIGVTKSVRASTKAKHLLTSLTASDAMSKIETFLTQSGLAPDEDVNLHDLSKHYNLESLDSLPRPILKRGESIPGTTILGKVVGLKGPLLVVTLDGLYKFVNLKRFIGYFLDLDSDVSIINQTGLSEFV